MKRLVKCACPLDCFDACGLLAEVADGRVVRLQGEPAHPLSRAASASRAKICWNASTIPSGCGGLVKSVDHLFFNRLTNDALSDMGENAAYHETFCRIEPLQEDQGDRDR